MARVGGYSADEVDALVVDFQQIIMRSIDAALAKTVEALPPESVTAAGSYGPNDAAAVTHAWEEEVDGVLTPYIASVYTGSATSIALGTATAFPDHDLPGVPLLPDDYALTYMKSRVNTLYNVSDELWEDVRNELVDGIQNGSSTKQVADKIKLLGQFNQKEAERIARTEMHSAVESGNHAQMLFMGFTDDEVQKVWEYTHDGRTRPTHVAAGGQKKPLNVPFEVGGSHLLFPGDPGGAADEIIHCRCTVLYDFDDPPHYRCNGQLVAAASSSPGGSSCVVPLAKADISMFSTGSQITVNNTFLQNKISPAYGGAKIHKTLEALRVTLKAGTPDMQTVEATATNRQLIAMVDKYYPAKGKTFGEVYDEWLQSPAGMKVVGPATPSTPLGIVTPTVAAPAPVTTPVTATTYVPKKLMPPSNHKFTILDDPGKSGDGSAPGGQWGKYGSSGVLVRAFDADGVPRFLLIQRGEKYIGSQKFKWQLPGGGLDELEGPYEAAAREMWEETAAEKDYVESMLPVGEMVYDGGYGWKYTTIGAHSDKGVFVPKVHGSTGDAQWFTLEQLQQMVDNGDIIKELSPTLMDVATDLENMAPAANPNVAGTIPNLVPKLPSVAPKPDPGNLSYTGKTLGSHGAQVWRDDTTGERWLFKPQQKFLTDLDIGIAKLQSKALQMRPGIYSATLNGKNGSLQYMFSSEAAWPASNPFSIAALSDDDIFVMQREQIFDWMISNFDTHSGQWIRLKPSGVLYGTDKGQAFKFFGHDKLDWDYVPVTPLGHDKLTYTKMWKDYVGGGKIALHDPTTGRLGEFIDRLSAIDDKTYKDLLRPYASQVKSGAQLEAFLDAAVARKNNLRKDFEDFWLRAQTERAKHVSVPTPSAPTPAFAPVTVPKVVPPPPPPPPAVVTPVPTGPAVGTGVSGDISGFDYFVKSDISQHWYTLGGDKKVTPAWGGAKIWKMLVELKKQEDAAWAHVGMAGQGPNELQLLRILDEFDGHTGKPKTLESVLMDWLETPNGKKAAGLNLPDSLKKTPPVGLPSATPAVTPIVSPAASTVDPYISALTSPKLSLNKAHDLILQADPGDTVLYGTSGFDQFKVTKQSSLSGAYNILVRQSPNSPLYDAANNDWKLFATTTHKSTLGGVDWYAAPKSVPNVFKTAPSKIVGKGPGDVIKLDELEASKWVWKDGDIMATYSSPTGLNDYKIVSGGDGSATIWSKPHSAPDSSYALDHTNPFPYLKSVPLGQKDWVLTNDVLLPAQKASGLGPNYNAGDVASTYDIFAVPATSPNKVVAYGQSASGWYRLKQQGPSFGGKMTIEYTPDPKRASWTIYGTTNNASHLDSWTGAANIPKWYAANADGSMPDILGVTVPGKSVPGVVKTQANKKGFYVGDTMDTLDIMESIFDNPSPGSVIAQGVSSNGTHWKIVYETDDTLHAKFIDAGGDYVDAGVVNDATEIPTVAQWTATDEWLTPATPTPLPKSSMPNKIAGDIVSNEEAWLYSTHGGTTVAYSYDPIHLDIWKVVDNGTGQKEMWVKGGGYSPNTWTKIGTAYNKNELQESHGIPWYAAKANGEPPDNLVAIVDAEKAKKAPVKKTAKKAAAKKAVPAKATVAAKPPGVYVPGKSVGDKVGPHDLWTNWQQYPDGQIVAKKMGYTGYYSTTLSEKWRLIKIDGKLVQQSKTKAGVWTQTKIVENQWDIEYGNSWILGNDTLSAADEKKLSNAVKKIEAKKAAPPPPKVAKKAAYSPSSSGYSSGYSTPAVSYTPPPVDITPWNDTEQKEIFDHFRGQGVYTSASPDSMWGATQSTKYYFQKKYGGKYLNLNEIELLRIMDVQRAAKKGVPNGHWYEGKVMNWLQTPAGKAYVNKKIDAPIAAVDVPIPMEDFAAGGDADKQTYTVLTKAQSLKNREDSHVKYGGWKTGEKSALKDYTGGVSGTWNSHIRKGDLSSYKSKILAAQNGMRPSVRPMMLHRGTDFTEFNDPRINSSSDLQAFVGTTYINRGFNSASFGGRAGFSSKKVILEIECPVGTPMSHAADYSHFPSENEVTLATHLIYRIISVRDSGSQTFVRVRVIGVGKP